MYISLPLCLTMFADCKHRSLMCVSFQTFLRICVHTHTRTVHSHTALPPA